MKDPYPNRDSGPPKGWVGLCDRCVHHRVVTSGRGSRFLLCERSKTDPTFPKYPPLPVLKCRGFEPESPD